MDINEYNYIKLLKKLKTYDNYENTILDDDDKYIEWLLVENKNESYEYHLKYFSFLPDEIIKELSIINFKKKLTFELSFVLKEMKNKKI